LFSLDVPMDAKRKARTKLLSQLAANPLPYAWSLEKTSVEDMSRLRDLADEKLIDAAYTPMQSGFGASFIEVYRIMPLGYALLAEEKPAMRLRALMVSQTFWIAIGALATVGLLFAAIPQFRGDKASSPSDSASPRGLSPTLQLPSPSSTPAPKNSVTPANP
jgi:hypothetical protein